MPSSPFIFLLALATLIIVAAGAAYALRGALRAQAVRQELPGQRNRWRLRRRT